MTWFVLPLVFADRAEEPKIEPIEELFTAAGVAGLESDQDFGR